MNKTREKELELIQNLMSNAAAWHRPWTPGQIGAADHNAASGHLYRGINTMTTSWARVANGYPTGQWLTSNQIAKAFGVSPSQVGRYLKGTKGKWLPILFWKFVRVTDKATGKEKDIPMLRYYNVVNVAEVNGDIMAHLPKREREFVQPEAIAIPEGKRQDIITDYVKRSGVVFKTMSGNAAYYMPSTDTIVLPEFGQFETEAAYFATAYHEIGHSTGHKDRLDRDLADCSKPAYSREELVAELTSAFLCSYVDIDNRMQNAAYLASWHKRLNDDPQWFMWAASRADKAATYILTGDVNGGQNDET
jgi:antirestriction protein ArdC